jgi:hypothetical protein
MQQVEQERFTKVSSPRGALELLHIQQVYNQMVDRITNLIDQNYRIRLQDAQSASNSAKRRSTRCRRRSTRTLSTMRSNHQLARAAGKPARNFGNGGQPGRCCCATARISVIASWSLAASWNMCTPS